MKPGNIELLRTLMSEAELSGILAFQQDNIRYISGYRPGGHVQKSMGTYSAFIPSDPSLSSALIVSEFDEMWARLASGLSDVRALRLWVEIDDLGALERGETTIRPHPVQFEMADVFAHIRGVLGDRGLLGGSVGCELSKLPSEFRRRLVAEVNEVDWVDASDLLWRAAMIKTPEEIGLLRRSVELSELGMSAALLAQDPRGRSVSQLRNDFEIAVRHELESDPVLEGYESSRIYMTAGGTIGPNVGRNSDVVTDGSLIWVDCGVMIDGYEADIGRTFQVGKADPLTERIAEALTQGSNAGFKLLQPGLLHHELFDRTLDTVRSAGLPTYTRGHVGHSIGAGGGEKPPFVTSGEKMPIVPGMVMAYERPYYVRGLGGFQFEDNFVVHESGIELLTAMPRGLIRI